MKLDKWPEEIECGGWRWRSLNGYSAPGEIGDLLVYQAEQKLHVPPTMKEIMEHLLKGGWLRLEYKDSICLWRLNKKGELQAAWRERLVFAILRWKVSESIGWYDPGAKLMLVPADPMSLEEA